MTKVFALLAVVLFVSVGAQGQLAPPVLPAVATKTLSENLDAARPHTMHVFRRENSCRSTRTEASTPTSRSRAVICKWELDMAANARAIDQ